MKVALVQLAAGVDKSANLRTIRSLTTVAAEHRPALVVLPEASMHEYGGPGTDLAAAAEPLDGPFVTALAELARLHGVHMVAGMFERSEDPARPYNTLVALSPEGDLLGRYRKIHLYDSFGFRESDKLLAGPVQPLLVDVEGLRMGLMTCYDLRFPELSRRLVDEGADALCVPAAWVSGPLKEDHWRILLRARAIENTCWVMAAAQCAPKYAGSSMLVDPMGVVVAGLGEAPGVVAGELVPGRLGEARETNPALSHRRL